jgi:hypothetical protein
MLIQQVPQVTARLCLPVLIIQVVTHGIVE